MIAEVYNYAGMIELENYAVNVPERRHFISNIEFLVNFCPFCWADFNWRIEVKEHRPFLPSDKGRWPILLILPYWRTKWGRQDLRTLHPRGRLLLHYKDKLKGIVLLLLKEGSRFVTGETIRKTVLLENVPEVIWAHEGYDMSYLALEKGEVMDILFEEVGKPHYRCKGKKPLQIKPFLLSNTIVEIYPNGFLTKGSTEIGNTRWGEVFRHNYHCRDTIKHLCEKYNLTLNEIDPYHVSVTPKEGGVQIPAEDLLPEEAEAGY